MQTSPEEAAQNVASIQTVPRELLPDGPARTRLLALAAVGRDVYAYHAGSADRGIWNLWLEHERIPIAEYVASFGGESKEVR